MSSLSKTEASLCNSRYSNISDEKSSSYLNSIILHSYYMSRLLYISIVFADDCSFASSSLSIFG